MGFTPQQVNDMSVWQFNAVAIGFAQQYEASGLSASEKDELWDWLQSKDDAPAAHRRPKGNGHSGASTSTVQTVYPATQGQTVRS
jgi:hypothetical protein